MWTAPRPVFPVEHEDARKRMIEHDLKGRDISDPSVLDAMARVPRHLFIPDRLSHLAYSDSALPIKENQTISQPYIVALMTQSAGLKPTDRVLEIGTGSGYQAAVLAEIVKEVFSIEIIETLAKDAAVLLKRLGYENIRTRHGDGYKGWAEEGPFDAILITAAAPKVPRPLIEQLKMGGRVVMPLGPQGMYQELIVLTRTEQGLEKKFITGVVFVPMTGEVRKD